MTRAAKVMAALFAVSVSTGQGVAQQAAQTAIPVRALTAAVSSDSGVFRSAPNVRALSNGSVLVNDRTMRRLVMLDSTLKKLNIIADTAPGAPNRYGAQVTGLIPFVGDSSIFIDNESQSMIVVDPTGRFGRVMAPPKASDLGVMATGVSTGFDEKGRLIYRVARRPAGPPRPASAMTDPSGKPTITTGPDSAAIVRADFDSRSVDTIMMIKIPLPKSMMVSPTPNMFMSTSVFNPLPQTDDWTLLPDGTIAVVRGQDYHLDWLGKDGKLTSTPKMPFDWKRITQEEKEQLIDSLKQAYEKRMAEAAANPAPPGGGRGDAGGGRGAMVETRGAAAAPPPPAFPGMPAMPAGFRMPFVTFEPSELPDYYPPVRAGMMRADLEGNVWLLPSTSTLSQGTILGGATAAQTSSLVYDVVGRDGVVKERVKLPPGRNIAAFGPNGAIFMVYAPVPNVVFIERARIVRSGASTQ
jgi:hypothetical protein